MPSILEYIKKYYEAPKTLMLSFAKLIEFYRTDMPKDDPEVMAFMKSASLDEILANENLWGQDLTFLTGELSKYVNKQAR